MNLHLLPDGLSVDSTMQEILATLPGAQRALFARYHLGGCSSCAFSQTETLAELCARSENISPQEALAHLLESHAHDAALLVEPALAKQKLLAANPPRLIDIRTQEEYAAVHLLNAEIFTQELQQILFTGNPEQEMILYDHMGKSALDQVAWFRGHGLRNTFALRGGIDAWSREVDSSVQRYKLEME